MAIRLSTGLRDYILATGSLRAGINNCLLNVYSGTVPADADSSIGAATLLLAYDAGSNLTFEATPVSGAIVKTAAQVWDATAAAGTVSFWRLYFSGDSQSSSSTTARRIQGIAGLVGGVGVDMAFANATLTGGQEVTVNSFAIRLPLV